MLERDKEGAVSIDGESLGIAEDAGCMGAGGCQHGKDLPRCKAIELSLRVVDEPGRDPEPPVRDSIEHAPVLAHGKSGKPAESTVARFQHEAAQKSEVAEAQTLNIVQAQVERDGLDGGGGSTLYELLRCARLKDKESEAKSGGSSDHVG
jgi:hypothetical protein